MIGQHYSCSRMIYDTQGELFSMETMIYMRPHIIYSMLETVRLGSFWTWPDALMVELSWLILHAPIRTVSTDLRIRVGCCTASC